MTTTGEADSSPAGGGDTVEAAIDGLAQAIEANAADEQLLADRLRTLPERRRHLGSWRRALAAEPTPGTLDVLGRVQHRLLRTGGLLRRSVVRALREEGVKNVEVARILGVSHQRISALAGDSLGDEPGAPD